MNHSKNVSPTQGLLREDLNNFSPIIDDQLMSEMQDSLQNHNSTNSNYYSNEDDTATGSSCDDEILAQLAQKDHDLLLAAELGKALLDKNEELIQRHEQLNEDYLMKEEELTQEKHAFKLKFENLEKEYETTVRELQSDINLLHETLEDRQSESKNGHKEKGHVIDELHLQNEKLAEQLRKSYESEKELRAQIRTLHDEMDLRRHTTQDSIHCMESFRSEIRTLKEKKMMLESKVRRLRDDKSDLTEQCEDLRDRLKETERICSQQQNQVKDFEKTIEELQERNLQLQSRFPNSNHVSMTSLDGGSTLYNELNMSGLAQAMSTESLDDPGAVRIGHQTNYNMMNFYGSNDPSMFDDDDDNIEYDDIDVCIINHNSGNQRLVGYPGNKASTTQLGAQSPDLLSQNTLTSNVSRDSLEDSDDELKQEILEVYRQLHRLVMELKGVGDQWSPETLKIEDMKVGSLLCVLKELRAQVDELAASAIDNEAVDALNLELDEQDEKQMTRMKVELITAESEVEKYKAEIVYKEEQLARRNEQIASLNRKLQQEQDISNAVRKERDQLIDDKLNLSRDEVIDEAREERDHALQQKNKTELELAQARLDSAHLDHQLMEAIQQKLELSQQLELWQVDMQELIDKQVSKRMKDEKKKEEDLKCKSRKTALSSPHKKRFSLFRR